MSTTPVFLERQKEIASLEAVIKRDGNRCHYCDRILGSAEWTRDHKIPKSKGGTNHIDNLVLSCKLCNVAKGDMSYIGFISLPYSVREQMRLRKSKGKRRRGEWNARTGMWVGEHPVRRSEVWVWNADKQQLERVTREDVNYKDGYTG